MTKSSRVWFLQPTYSGSLKNNNSAFKGVIAFKVFIKYGPIFHQMTQIDNYSTGSSQINIFTSLHVGFISGYGTQMMEPLVGKHYCRAFSAGSAINAINANNSWHKYPFCSISLHYNHCYLCHSELNKLLKGGKRTCAVVVAQLTKRSLPIPEVHSSKSNIGKIFQYVRQFYVNRIIVKRVNKEKVTKRGWEHKSSTHDSTSLVHYGIVLQLKHDSKKVGRQKCSSGKSSKSS